MKYKQGLVSVIIPLYNRIDYIDETVNSVLMQDYPNIELIIVDDGSTDGSYEKVKSLASNNESITVITHAFRVNKGQSAALNVGLKRATGEFIAILDSDDMFADGKLAWQVEYLNKHPETGLVYGLGKAIDEHGRFLYDIHHKLHQEYNDPNRILLDCYFLLPQNSLVRHCIYNDVGEFEESYRSAQDHDMLIRIAEKTKLAFVSKQSFYYRRHQDSISINGLEVRWRTGFKVLKSAQDRYPYKGSTIRKRAAVLNYHLSRVLLGKKKNYFEAISRFFLAGLLDPLRAIRVITGKEKTGY